MNTASAERARDALARVGKLISVRRMTTSLPQTVVARADVRAIVKGYQPVELVNGITAGSRRVILSVLDLVAAGFPMPVKKGDRIYLGEALDVPTTIASVDPDHREYTGCLDISTTGT